MKQFFSSISDIAGESIILLLIVLAYWMVAMISFPPTGKEIHLLESAREALNHIPFIQPHLNNTLSVPVSPLLTIIVGTTFKVFSATLLNARVLILVITAFCMTLFYLLGSRLFQQPVGLLSSGFLLASWGFVTNSIALNGAMLYVMLMLIAFYLFFHWLDCAFRSRTFARSLYKHFILLGCTFGLAYCTYGLPGILFPLAVMVTVIAFGKRPEVVQDIHYKWLVVPFAIIAGLWTVLGMISTGPLAFLVSIFGINLNLYYFFEPVVYLLPVLPLLVPAILNKDIWSRALITHPRSLYLLFACVGWSVVFSILFNSFHEAFSLMITLSVILWLGFYLNEVFRNPVLPKPLSWTLDAIVFLVFLFAIATLIFTFQLVPPDLKPAFFITSAVLPVIAIVIMLLKDVTISRALPVYVLPGALVFCVLMRMTYQPLFALDPDQAFSKVIAGQVRHTPNLQVFSWMDNPRKTASYVRFVLPLTSPIISVNQLDQLESSIQTRRGVVDVILPESAFYSLPTSLREEGTVLKTAWRWKKSLTLWTLIQALQDETLDFRTLAEPIFLLEVPAEDGTTD